MSCVVDIIYFVDKGICDGDFLLIVVLVDDGQMEMWLWGQENKKFDFFCYWNDEFKYNDFEEL